MASHPAKHIIVGMSGGVDSSVAAYLLKKAGHFVEAVFMKNWEENDTDFCPHAQDIADAKSVCDQLKIDLQVVNFATEYWQNVFSYFLDAHRLYLTPNPDVLCNKEIKFKTFLNYAQGRGADFIATGHYARIISNKEKFHLTKASDLEKDQSYFLYLLNQEQLKNSLFPLGEMQKKNVRQLAKELNFINYAKKDSTGICFIGERKFATFLQDYLPKIPGKIINIDGEIVGQHAGLMYYTIGQRQGLQIGGKKNKNGQPWYVVNKDLNKNLLVVAQGKEHPALYKKTTQITNLHWINATPHFPLRCKAKIRYRQTDQTCEVNKSDNDYLVEFIHPQRALTPGQSIVFYQNDICLGGGMIKKNDF